MLLLERRDHRETLGRPVHRETQEELVQQDKLDLRVPPGLRVKQVPLERLGKQVMWVLLATQVQRERRAIQALPALLALLVPQELPGLLDQLVRLELLAILAQMERRA